MRVCFITVGTTKFDQLIETLDNNCTEFLKLLHRKGIEKIIIQLGKGVHMPRKLVEVRIRVE